MFKKSYAIILMIGASIFFISSMTNGADFPRKPVKIIVTAGVGGGEDTELRAFLPFLQKQLGVMVSIEDIGGAGGKIACEKFERTEPDGYTLLYSTFPKTIVLEYTNNVNYKTKNFTPIYAWTRSDQMLVVHVDQWKTFDEFMNAARSRTLVGGVTGRGSTTHTAGVLAVDALGIKVNWVPYEGSGETLAALAGKHIDFVVNLISTSAPLIEGGRLRPLMVFSEQRDPYFPDVIIPKDLGLTVPSLPGIRGIVAPPHTPATIVKPLEEAIAKAVKDPGYVDLAKKKKLVLFPLSADEFGKVILEAYPKVEKIAPLLKQ